MKNSNLKSIFDQTGQKKIENNLRKGLFRFIFFRTVFMTQFFPSFLRLSPEEFVKQLGDDDEDNAGDWVRPDDSDLENRNIFEILNDE